MLDCRELSSYNNGHQGRFVATKGVVGKWVVLQKKLKNQNEQNSALVDCIIVFLANNNRHNSGGSIIFEIYGCSRNSNNTLELSSEYTQIITPASIRGFWLTK